MDNKRGTLPVIIQPTPTQHFQENNTSFVASPDANVATFKQNYNFPMHSPKDERVSA